jgi:hypothetical protein
MESVRERERERGERETLIFDNFKDTFSFID